MSRGDVREKRNQGRKMVKEGKRREGEMKECDVIWGMRKEK